VRPANTQYRDQARSENANLKAMAESILGREQKAGNLP
jgi:hypothetical protein